MPAKSPKCTITKINACTKKRKKCNPLTGRCVKLNTYQKAKPKRKPYLANKCTYEKHYECRYKKKVCNPVTGLCKNPLNLGTRRNDVSRCTKKRQDTCRVKGKLCNP